MDTYEMSDEQLKSWACSLYANWIETGNPTMSAIDYHNAGLEYNPLDESQMELVVRLRRLARDGKSS